MYQPKKISNIFFFFALAGAIGAAYFFFSPGSIRTIVNRSPDGESAPKSQAQKISGWIAWWKEAEGFAIAQKYGNNLDSVSPGWLKLDKSKKLVEIGQADKTAEAAKIKRLGIRLFPMIVTDLSGQELADFTKDKGTLDNFARDLIDKLKTYQADGLDLDFENIGAEHRENFSLLVKTIGEELKKNDLEFSVDVQAQTGKNDWEGLKGQDLGLISKYADEVRIMAYDRHGQFSAPGPITPMDWFAEVLKYNLSVIPREKIVIGLPTYGYVWRDDGSFESFQFEDFVSWAENKNLGKTRDSESFELKYALGATTGWLSDAVAVSKKMEYARNAGLNRFIVWNLGGTDEKLFEYLSGKAVE